MSLIVLSDEIIGDLLENLAREEVEDIAEALKTALHEYSTGTQAGDADISHQPEQTSIYSDRSRATTIFMPLTSPAGDGVKVVTVSSLHADPSLPTFKPTGSLTLHSPEGNPIGLLCAQTITAFRTALASSCLLTKRANVRTLTVFGAGLQAYWHIRLALMLRGSTIRVVNIINRRFSDNAKEILGRLYAMPVEVKEREGWAAAQFSLLTPGYGEYGRLQKENIRAADVIYCCTPSNEELFDASILTNHEGRKKGRLIIAIGSYAREMRELPVELLIQVTRPHQPGHLHYHKHATEGGVVIVDSLKGALQEAGEIIDAGLEPKQLVELGELIMIKRQAAEDSSSSQALTGEDSLPESFDKLDVTPASSVMESESGGSRSGNGGRSSSQSPLRLKRDGDTGVTQPASLTGLHIPVLRRLKSTTNRHSSTDEKNDDHLSRWMTSGNVIYKSVGLGLMDLVVGLEVIKLADAKGMGARVENFSR
ncbi:UbiD family decarboxylase [Xylaria intraflava]|nr:UbiD family decarboxylase [Xylaria intraflava]